MRGLNTKLNSVLVESSVLTHDMLALSETWLTFSVYSNELFDPALYLVYRADRRLSRKKTRGGGVLIAARQVLKTTLFDTSLSSFEDIDIIGVRLLENCEQILLLVIYIPPSIIISVFNDFLDALSELLCKVNCKIIIAGDFNINKFFKHQASLVFDVKAAQLNNFNNFIKLDQYNIVINYQGNCLDLVLSNIKCNVEKSDWSLVNLDAYHPALTIDFSLLNKLDKTHIENIAKHKYNYRKYDKATLIAALYRIDWSDFSSDLNPNLLCEIFYTKLEQVFDTVIPKAYIHQASTFPIWFTTDIIVDLRNKEYHRQ